MAAYATIDELQTKLRIEQPTQLQVEGMSRSLDAATAEIDWELGYTPESPAPSPLPALVVSVCIDRAVEHWRQSFSPFGAVLVGGAEGEALVVSRNTWRRHALKLAPLKTAYGVA